MEGQTPRQAPEPAQQEKEQKPERIKVVDAIYVQVNSAMYSSDVLARFPGYVLFNPDKHDMNGIEPRLENLVGASMPTYGYTLVKEK